MKTESPPTASSFTFDNALLAKTDKNECKGLRLGQHKHSNHFALFTGGILFVYLLSYIFFRHTWSGNPDHMHWDVGTGRPSLQFETQKASEWLLYQFYQPAIYLDTKLTGIAVLKE